MYKDLLSSVFYKFQHNAEFRSYEALTSGHINATYLIKTEAKPFYVLQSINPKVFTDIPNLIQNKVRVSEHIQQKLAQSGGKFPKKTALQFVKSNSGKAYVEDDAGNVWNMMLFIEGGTTYDAVPHSALAYEAGLLIGEFLKLTEDFDAEHLVDVIPKFHDMDFRYHQFEVALKSAKITRLKASSELIHQAKSLKEEMHVLQSLKAKGILKSRVTHNDTKISNMLFDAEQKGLCMIDTDTVMPGLVHYDFGDAVRTICSTATEDETDLDKVKFNMNYYRDFKKGFLEMMETSLTRTEQKYLPLAVKTMIFIIGLRFLTDYLNNDIYFKVNYNVHNLDRAKNQFKLMDSFTKQML